MVNRVEARQSEDGSILSTCYDFGLATAQFRFNTPQLVEAKRISRLIGDAGCFILAMPVCVNQVFSYQEHPLNTMY